MVNDNDKSPPDEADHVWVRDDRPYARVIVRVLAEAALSVLCLCQSHERDRFAEHYRAASSSGNRHCSCRECLAL